MLLCKTIQKTVFVIVCICMALGVQAQIFLRKDSVRQIPIIQFAQGGYVGQHLIKPTSTDFTYNNANGYDHGLFIKLISNITKAWSVSIDARTTDKSCYVSLQNDVFSESFDLQITGLQVPLLVSYAFQNSKQQELFMLSAGIAFNRMKFDTKNSHFEAFIPAFSTSAGVDEVRGNEKKYPTYLFSLSKKIKFNKRNSLVIFSEWEYNPEVFVISNLFIRDSPLQPLRYNSEYVAYSIRFGIYITL
ncbi:MAG: hypothetical protein EAY81_05005 [Bacteroidetes bacterium]|nr:MAG: hypothetical protein EAY81_05005 [Bacteroidota bacterium]